MIAMPTLEKYPLVIQALHDITPPGGITADQLQYFESVTAILDGCLVVRNREELLAIHILTSAHPDFYTDARLQHVHETYGETAFAVTSAYRTAGQRDELQAQFPFIGYFEDADHIVHLRSLAGQKHDSAALARMRHHAQALKQSLIPFDSTEVRLRAYLYAAYQRIPGVTDTPAAQQKPPKR